MQVRSALLALLTISPLCAALQPDLSRVPLGFERQGSRFAARSLSQTVVVDGHGAEFQFPGSSIRLGFASTRAHPTLLGEGNAGSLNLFIGSDGSAWRAGVPLYDRVRAKGVYDGVSAVFHGQRGAFEYDFIVSPGANPAQIRLKVIGALSLSLDPSGDLRIHGPVGDLIQRRPAAFQSIAGVRREIESRFVIDSDRAFHFALGAYDPRSELTIDPVLSYASYFGGTAVDEFHAAAADTSGDFYAVGRTLSSTASGNSNVLLLKFTPTGSIVESVFGGSNGTDTANAVVTDSDGNVYLAGSSSSTNFPLVNAYQAGLEGSMNAFVLGLNAANTGLIFSTYFGGTYADQALAMAIGPSNNLYIVGDTSSGDFTVIAATASPFQLSNFSYGVGYDAFLVSFTSAGVPNFGTYLGGEGDDHAYGVAVDSAGAVYVVGTTASSDFPVSPYPGFPEPFQLTLHGSANAFAIKFFPNGSEAYWSTYIGGENSDSANAVVLDSSGNLYIAGTTSSTEFPTFTGAFQADFQGGASDGFVLSLQNDGEFANWSTFLGGTADDVLNAVALDSSGNVYVAGATDGTDFPVTSDAAQSANAGGQDIVLSKLNTAGSTLLFSTYFGGSGNDVATGLALDSSGHVFVDGITASSNDDFPVTSGAQQTEYGGGTSDGFFAEFGCSSAAPAIGSGGVVNGASFASGVAPGGIFSIFGTNLACTAASASAVPLPTTLSGTSVTVNGVAVPLFYVGETQINAQMPYATAVGSATIAVTSSTGTSTAVSVPILDAAPGIFLINSRSATLNQDGTLNTAANPATVGSYISVYFTGEGPLSGTLTTGAVTPTAPLYTVTLANSATIGGLPATVAFMGAAPGLVGVGQANLIVPAVNPGDYPIVLTIGGVASAAATVSVVD